MSSQLPPTSYQTAYFHLTLARLAQQEPFDIVVIGSGIGGGVLAAALLEKNGLLTEQESYNAEDSTPKDGPLTAPRAPSRKPPCRGGKGGSTDNSKRILVIERGGLVFHTHCLNGPRPTNLGSYGQQNDEFYQKFKNQFCVDSATENWVGGPVYTLGGRSTVWGLFTPRVNDNTLSTKFPPSVVSDLQDMYYRKSEQMMNLRFPATLPLHQEVIDTLNRRDAEKQSTLPSLPTTTWQWGRIASEFANPKNYDFAQGAYSSVDRLLEAAMNDPDGMGKFNILLEGKVSNLMPKYNPQSKKVQTLSGVVVKGADGAEHTIRCRQAVLAAGSVESAAILLRSSETGSPSAFGSSFGHVTDHRIFGVRSNFIYRDMTYKNVIGGMKLETDFKFDDGTIALANLSLDATAFLPRRDLLLDPSLPILTITFILPSELVQSNSVKLDKNKDPIIHVQFDTVADLEQKKKLMRTFSADIMNKFAMVLSLEYVEKKENEYVVRTSVTPDQVVLEESGPGVVAHELGTIPMPNSSGRGGLVDQNLKLTVGWDNVYVCDLSVFPYSPAANPTLTLGALALRLADTLIPVHNPLPIIVYNFTQKTVWVRMSLSQKKQPSFGPETESTFIQLKSGTSETWGRVTREMLQVRATQHAAAEYVQIVYPGINAFVVQEPPSA